MTRYCPEDALPQWPCGDVIPKTGAGFRFHSQDSQYTAMEMAEIARTGGRSMSRRGNCHNNAVCSFQLLKRERIKKRKICQRLWGAGYPWRFSPNKGYLKYKQLYSSTIQLGFQQAYQPLK